MGDPLRRQLTAQEELEEALGDGLSAQDELAAALEDSVQEPPGMATPGPVVQPDEGDASLWDEFANTASDAWQGGVKGLTRNWGDEGTAKLASGIGKASQAVGLDTYNPDYSQQLDVARSREDLARERSPRAFEIARALGSLPGDLFGTAESALGAGGAMGALDAGGESRASVGTPQFTKDVAAGGAAGMALPGALQGLGGLFRGAGALARGTENVMRGHVGGGTTKQYHALGQELGLENMPASLNEGLKRAGVVNKVVPQTSLDLSVALRDKVKAAGASVADLTAAADRQGVRGNRGETIAELQNLADSARGSDVVQDVGENLYGRLADKQLENYPSPEMTPTQAWNLKKAYEGQGYSKGAGFAAPSDQEAASAYRSAADIPRRQLYDMMDQQAPELAGPMREGMETMQQAIPLRDLAARRAAEKLSAVSSIGQGAFGSGMGAALGYGIGGVGGALAGAGGGFLGRQYGPGAVANVARPLAAAGEGIGSGLGHAAQALSRGAPPPPWAGAGPGMGRFNPLPQGAPPSLAGGLSNAGTASAVNAWGDARGHEMPKGISQGLQQHPEAFGPYLQQFAEAEKNGSTAALIDRLEQSDPAFRTQWSPRIRMLGQGVP